MTIKKVFLSSTYRDLKDYREVAYRDINCLDSYKCVWMEDFGAKNWASDKYCRAKVGECDIFVGILGHLYGSCPNGSEQSYTEREYEVAVEAGIPRLMFLAPSSLPPNADLRESEVTWKKQLDFRGRVSEERVRETFNDPQDLGKKVIKAIYDLERESKGHGKKDHKTAYSAPFLAPSLPKHFVPRPEVSNKLKDRLLTYNSDRSGVLAISALHGLGGIGKTMLATYLASDREVMDYFSGGVLWTTLGQEPQILSLLNNLIRELGDHDFPTTTPEAASAHLGSLLRDRAVLLVVDDAWYPEHVKPFLVGGSNCQVLITTRRASVVDEIDAERYELDVMTPDQSLELLSSKLGRSIEDVEREDALLVAESLGYLPLALKLAAERIKRKISWKDLNDALEKEISFLEGPRRRRTGKMRLDACMNLSFKALYSEDEDAWRAFVWLGILPEDVKIAAPMAATLWGLDDKSEAEDLLELLWDEALLLQDKNIRSEDLNVYRLHDLLHERAGRFVSSPEMPRKEDDLPGLGLKLREAHARLLERYLAETQEGLWYSLPEDGYIHANLVWHMEKAKQIEEIHALLQKETPEGRNGWYQTCDCLGQAGEFTEDVTRAWKLSEKGNELDLEIQYAFAIASINSLSANIPPNLIAQLVEYELWSIAQGLAYALQNPYSNKRDQALAQLSSSICTKNPQKALEVARQIQDVPMRVKALADIASNHPDPQEALNEALEIARQIQDVSVRTKALAYIASKHPDPQKALEVARQIQDVPMRVKALADIASNHPDPQEALNLVSEIEDETIRSEVIVQIILRLPKPQEGLVVVMEIKNVFLKNKALNEIAITLPHPKDALIFAEEITDAPLKDKTLSNIAIKDPEYGENSVYWKIKDNRLRRETAIKIKSNENTTQSGWGIRDRILSKICRSGSGNNMPKPVSTEPNNTQQNFQRPNHLQELLIKAKQIKDGDVRAKTLANIAEEFTDTQKMNILKDACAIAETIEDKNQRIDILFDIAIRFQEPQKTDTLKKAFKITSEIDDEYARATTMSKIATECSGSRKSKNLKDSLAASKDIRDDVRRSKALAYVATKFPEDQKIKYLKEALNATKGIEDKCARAKTLAEIAIKFQEPQKTDILNEAFSVAETIESEYLKDLALAEIASNHSKAQDAYTMAKKIKDGDVKSKTLAQIAVNNPIIEDALAIAAEIPNNDIKDDLLVEIAFRLPRPEDAFAIADRIKSEQKGEKLLIEIALKFLKPEESLDEAKKIENNNLKLKALIEIAPNISEPHKTNILKEALEITRDLNDENLRGKALSDISLDLAGLPPSVLYPLWQETLHVLAQRTRSDLLSDLCALTPVILALGGPEALEETARAIVDVGRWWP